VSEENKREEGRPEVPSAAEQQQESPAAEQPESAASAQAEPAPERKEPANTQEVAGTEPAGAGAEHPNQPQPDTMPGQPQAEAAPEQNAHEQSQAAGEPKPAASSGEGAASSAGAGAAVDPEREAKIKAAQEARAARLAAKAAAEGGAGAGAGAAVDPEREAKIKAAQEARAARLAAKAAAEGAGAAGDAPAEPKPPSPKQPWLDEAVELLKTEVHPEAVEEAVINELAGDMPTITVKAEHWRAAAELLRDHEKLGCRYLRNVTGVDYETHMEVVYFVINLETKREYAIKIRTDREQPSVPSATPVWPGANWPEREVYDLLGIDFPGHPDLRRILMPDDWVGHPLRKDYVPLDPEV
jgi:NADH-quinone oxidoreductase subunit C